MKTRYAAGVFGFFLAIGLSTGVTASHVAAQVSGYQTLSSPAGYQLAVPSDWQVPTTPGAPSVFASSADGSEQAYVLTVPPPPADGLEGAIPGSSVLQNITQDAMNREVNSPSYAVLRAAAPAQVAGADAANSGAVTYTDAQGVLTDEYLLTAVRGLSGYTLVVSLPASADAANPRIAQTILTSFQLGNITGSERHLGRVKF